MTSGDRCDSSDQDMRLEMAVAAYLKAVDKGEAFDRSACLAQHPDLADRLRDVFEAHDQLTALRRGRDPSSAEIRCVDGYQLHEELGRGVTGVVYRATHVSRNRTMAVKLFRDGRLLSPLDIEFLRMDTGAAAGLQHPNIVAVYEIGEHQGRLYLSMACVEGTSLAKRIRKGPLPAIQAANYVQQIARALHDAHQQGIHHGAVRPSKILLDRNDQPYLTGLGLARWPSDRGRPITRGLAPDTLGYLSPERATATHNNIAPASDVYSLGAVLYASLTGRPPFLTPSARNTLDHLVHRPPIPPRALNEAVPRGLQTLCLKCLAKDPAHRPTTAAHLADDLQGYLDAHR